MLCVHYFVKILFIIYIQYKINILDVSVFNNCKFNVMALSILFH